MKTVFSLLFFWGGGGGGGRGGGGGQITASHLWLDSVRNPFNGDFLGKI